MGIKDPWTAFSFDLALVLQAEKEEAEVERSKYDYLVTTIQSIGKVMGVEYLEAPPKDITDKPTELEEIPYMEDLLAEEMTKGIIRA